MELFGPDEKLYLHSEIVSPLQIHKHPSFMGLAS
jgi:hypothetical protein